MTNNKILVSPSILSADFSKLNEEVLELEKSGADFLHIDVMDGHFVPNLTFGWKLIEDIRKLTNITFDVHLMITEPEKYIENFVKAGADIITIHYEATTHLDRTISIIKSFGKKVGIALNPTTSESVLEYIIDKLDMILIMSVNPGFGGQSFIQNQLIKIAKIKQMIANKNIILEVDGGISIDNIQKIITAGANSVVAGSYIFNSGNYKTAIENLKK
jgi:ribulose-phosphate 3-epimerase